MTKFDATYQSIIKQILTDGVEELNQRTGHKTKSLPGINFQVDIEKDGFPVLTLRKQPLKSPIAEQIWFLQGTQDTAFLRKFTKIWDLFLEDDGTLPTAYGYRWRKHFNRDQIGELVRSLQEDPSSRHGVVITWDPASDGLGGKPKKNVPCPYTFTVNIIGGRLHLHNIVRSNDMMLGCPFDVFGFALLQCILAQKLGVRPGVYTHSISNAHIYDNHYAGAKELTERTNEHTKIELTLPEQSFDRAENIDENLVLEIFENIQKQYNPLPPIEGLTIAV